MHQALYRKWRPKNFDEVIGQEHITSILKYECSTGNFSHAYLFCGSRGTGKTSCAKILSKAVNCEHPTGAGPCGACAACRAIDTGGVTDVLEMDAASNNGVDDIRGILDEVVYAPSSLKYRVYIIDEVHMLSPSAFNALLKTLEEPPAHVVFILATTELHKLPATIISRCQRFDFRRIATSAMADHLRHIAGCEGIDLTDEGAYLIARQAQGGMRDAISLLELCAGTGESVTADLVLRTVGMTGKEESYRTVRAIAGRDYEGLFGIIDEIVNSSRDITVFWQELIAGYRDMLVTKITGKPEAYLDLTDTERASLTETARLFTKEMLLFHIGLLEDALFAMQKSFAVKRTVAEMTLIRLCDPALDTSPESMLARLSKVEEQLFIGVPAGKPDETATLVGSSPSGGVADQGDPVPVGRTVSERTDVPTAASPDESSRPADTSKPDTSGDGTRAGTGASLKADSPAKKPGSSPDTDGGTNRRVLRPLRKWMEVVERMGKTNPIEASFLTHAKAYTTETGGVVVRFPDEFSRNMSQGNQAGEALRSALSVCIRQKLHESDLCLEVEPKDETALLLDLIIEAAEEP